jgi:hypothetical protein
MKKKNISWLLFIISIFINSIFITGCDEPTIFSYPWRPASTVKSEAQNFSNALEAYIKDWMDGRVPALIPVSVLPTGIYLDSDGAADNSYSFQLEAKDATTPDNYWCVRKAAKWSKTTLTSMHADIKYTYIIRPILSPYGSKIIMKGKYPKARYFQITATQPTNGLQYYYSAFGPPENPLIDVDITPDAGSINPFLVGANRNATNRNYTVTLEFKIADSGSASATYVPKPPFYRSSGNTRYVSGIRFRGPGPYGPPSGYPNGL